MYQNLHIDVLETMARSWSEQLDRGAITTNEFNQQIVPLITEISSRVRIILEDHERRVKTAETNVMQKELQRDRSESYRSHDMAIETYDAFLESKGLADEFEEFECQRMLKRRLEGTGGGIE